MTVDKITAFIIMAMPTKNQIHSCLFQNGQSIFTHFNVLYLHIRVMAALGIWRMMPESDYPLLCSRSEVLLKPCQHRAIDGAIGFIGIQTNKMNICVIERIIRLRT